MVIYICNNNIQNCAAILYLEVLLEDETLFFLRVGVNLRCDTSLYPHIPLTPEKQNKITINFDLNLFVNFTFTVIYLHLLTFTLIYRSCF